MYSEGIVGEISTSVGISKKYRHLATVMGLPLADGVFISIILSGGLSSLSDSMLVGMFVLGGFATVGVIVSEFNGDTYDMIKKTLIIGLAIGIFATLQAVLAPSIGAVIDTEIFKYGAMLALLSISIQMLPIDITDKIIGPTPIVGIFLVLSIRVEQAPSVSYNFDAVPYALLAVATAISFCILTILVREHLAKIMNENMMRYATSAGLIMIMMSIGGYVPNIAPTISFAGYIFSFDRFQELIPF